jgi:hypothetical protein
LRYNGQVHQISRRQLIASGALVAGALVVSPRVLREALAAPSRAAGSPYGELGAPDANGLMLPPGFTSREIARGQARVAGYTWPKYSDGQATFGTADGGWILVTNSEWTASAGAGASAIRFGPDGSITGAYRILGGTNANCAGGPTPWGTWLSCEEYDQGLVWECDPAGAFAAQSRPEMGVFWHEAAAVDPVRKQVYMTEDRPDGGLYRFTPHAYPDLAAGLLEVAVVAADDSVTWRAVPDPTPAVGETPTRHQVDEMTPFASGEGIWHDGGVIYFTTKGDGRLWAYDAAAATLEIVFDPAAAPAASLDAVDNVTVSAAGEIFVCEDGGNMEIALITPEREVSPFLRFTGRAHPVSGGYMSEVCGVVFDPSGTRMYCTSQRAHPPGDGSRGPGAVYEITGPFAQPGGDPGGDPGADPGGEPGGDPRGDPGGDPGSGPGGDPGGEPGGGSGGGSTGGSGDGSAGGSGGVSTGGSGGGSPAGGPFGPPAGERPRSPLQQVDQELLVRVPRRVRRSSLLREGLRVEVIAPPGANVSAVLDTPDLLRSPGRGSTVDRPRTVALARTRFKGLERERRPRLRIGPTGRLRLSRSSRSLTVRLLVTARLPDGRRLSEVRRILVTG